MKFLSVRDLKTKSSQVWKELAGQKEMIVTSNGRPIALLSSINEKMPMHLAPNKTVPVHRSLQVSQKPSTKFLYTLLEGGYVAKIVHFSKSTLESVGNVA